METRRYKCMSAKCLHNNETFNNNCGLLKNTNECTFPFIKGEEEPVAKLQRSDVLFALREEYEWLVEENKAMEENPDNYPEVDHYGLPYCKKVLESIANKANVELESK